MLNYWAINGRYRNFFRFMWSNVKGVVTSGPTGFGHSELSIMLRTIGFAILVAIFLAHVPSEVAAQKKKPADMVVADPATPKDYKILANVKELTGKLASVSNMTLTFRLDIPHMEPNPNYRPPKKGGGNNQNQQMQQLYRQQAEIMRITNPVQRQQRMQQLMATMQKQQMQQLQQAAKAAQNQNNPNNAPFRLAHDYKDFEFELAEKVSIRKLNLDLEYDDKGFPKTYTKEELTELRGKDPSKPGYTARLEDLQPAQEIKIYLAAPKKVKAEDAEEKGAKPAAKGENVEKPVVNMIVIIKQTESLLATGDQKKKKK